MLKQLIEKNDSLSACIVDQLQQPMVRGQKLDYVQGIKNFSTTHKLNMTPFSYGPIPVVASVWPNSISSVVEQDLQFLKLESPHWNANHHKLSSNEGQWRSSNRPPQGYQQSREWLDRDVFAFVNAPTRQSSLLDNTGITPSCMHSRRHVEQHVMDLNSFGRMRCQSLHQTYDKQYERIEINRNIKQKDNTSIFQGQVWQFLLIQFI